MFIMHTFTFQKNKFLAKSSKNKSLSKNSRISASYSSKCVKNVSQTMQLVGKNDDSLNVMKNFVDCFVFFYNWTITWKYLYLRVWGFWGTEHLRQIFRVSHEFGNSRNTYVLRWVYHIDRKDELIKHCEIPTTKGVNWCLHFLRYLSSV